MKIFKLFLFFTKLHLKMLFEYYNADKSHFMKIIHSKVLFIHFFAKWQKKWAG